MKILEAAMNEFGKNGYFSSPAFQNMDITEKVKMHEMIIYRLLDYMLYGIAKGSVTDTLLPMTILDDIIGIAVFFTVNSLIARMVSGGAVPLYMIPVMIFLPIITGVIVGFPTGLLLKKCHKKLTNLTVLLCGITVTMLMGWLINIYLLSGITINYMLMGVSFSAAFSNMITSEQFDRINSNWPGR